MENFMQNPNCVVGVLPLFSNMVSQIAGKYGNF